MRLFFLAVLLAAAEVPSVRFIDIAALMGNNSQHVIGIERLAVQLNSLPELRDRFVILALICQNQTEVVVRGGVARVTRNRLPITLCGLRQIALIQVSVALRFVLAAGIQVVFGFWRPRVNRFGLNGMRGLPRKREKLGNPFQHG